MDDEEYEEVFVPSKLNDFMLVRFRKEGEEVATMYVIRLENNTLKTSVAVGRWLNEEALIDDVKNWDELIGKLPQKIIDRMRELEPCCQASVG